MKSKTILGFIAFFTLLLSCNKEVAVTDISLDPSDIVMYVGESKAISISISPSDATDQEIVWSTSNQYVATVDGNTIKALSGGTATLTATVSNGKSARCVVTVMNHVDNIDFGLNMLELGEGEAYELKVTITPEKYTDKTLTWASSDEKVAIIENGSIIAQNKGKTTITASSVDGIKQSVDVFVNPVMNGQYYVDLGLSVKWAVKNVGASTRKDFGNHYCWGETRVRAYGDNATYKFFLSRPYEKLYINKYFTQNIQSSANLEGTYDNLSILEEEDDIVAITWGKGWRMPTVDEYQELYDNCSFKWEQINGTYGVMLTSKIEGYQDRCLFLPAGGHPAWGLSTGANQNGYYWTSSLFETYPTQAWSFHFSDGEKKIDTQSRAEQFHIRGVIE